MNFFRKLLLYSICLVMVLPAGLAEAMALTPSLNIYSETYVVMDANTGQVLIEKDMHRQKAPASITKILTCAIALDQEADLDKMVTMDRESVYSIPSNTTHIALEEGETVSLYALLRGTMLISANDAANGVALGVAGNLDSFVSMMNQQLAQIGTQDTHFANPHGLDDPQHYTSAYDMALITKWAITVPGFRELFGTTEYDFPATNRKVRDYKFYAQDSMLYEENKEYYPGVEGGKLGYTDNAGHTIVTLAKRGDMELICVAMDSSGRSQKYEDTAALLDYCFEHFQALTLRGRELDEFTVPVGNRTDPDNQVNIRQREDFTLLVPLGVKKSDLTYTYDIPDLYRKESDVSPTFSVLLGGEVLQTFPMEFEIVPYSAASKPAGAGQFGITATDPGERFIQLMIVLLKCLGVVLAIAVIALFFARFFIRWYYRRQRKKRSDARPAPGAREPAKRRTPLPPPALPQNSIRQDQSKVRSQGRPSAPPQSQKRRRRT